jgi:hypothetical protein
VKGEGLTKEDVAERIDQDVLGPWRELRQRLAAVEHFPRGHQERGPLLQEYMQACEEFWELIVSELREQDASAAKKLDAQSTQKLERLRALDQKLNALSKR